MSFRSVDCGLSRVERTLNTGDAHPVDDVVREAEGNPLGNFKGPTLRSV
jgi:hypothetical protein